MLRWRLTSDAQPRSKNGQPPHSTDRRREDRAAPRPRLRRRQRIERQSAPKCSAIAMTSSGTDSADADPEAPRHVGEFGVARRRPRPGSSARAPCRRSGRCPARCARSPDASGRSTARPAGAAGADAGLDAATEALGLGDEALAASGAAEEIVVAGMLGAVPRGRRIDAHAADRVCRPARRRRFDGR